MMQPHDEPEPRAKARWGEPIAWLGCLMAAVLPTAVLTSFVQAVDRAVWPGFTPLIYVGVFTVMVLLIRPWSLR